MQRVWLDLGHATGRHRKPRRPGRGVLGVVAGAVALVALVALVVAVRAGRAPRSDAGGVPPATTQATTTQGATTEAATPTSPTTAATTAPALVVVTYAVTSNGSSVDVEYTDVTGKVVLRGVPSPWSTEVRFPEPANQMVSGLGATLTALGSDDATFTRCEIYADGRRVAAMYTQQRGGTVTCVPGD
jgi:hypothetical protein